MVKSLYWATESRFQRGPDGVVRSPHPGDSYDTYVPMLQHFDKVVVLARVSSVNVATGVEVEGHRLRVCPLPDYVGLVQAISRHLAVRRAINAQIVDAGAYYGGKAPGLISAGLSRLARRRGRPFLVNVVGDPQDVLATGTLGRFAALGAFFARISLQRLVRSADAVVYVSENYLQQKYPARNGVPQLARSNVRLPESAFAAHDQRGAKDNSWRLITVGSQDQLYKGHDLLIQVTFRLRAIGVMAELHLVGAGRRQEQLRQLAEQLGVDDHVIFHGHVSGLTQVQALLDQSDIYLQPSRTEGVPRALIEAMARRLPCVGSSAGGIPELLDPEAVFPVGGVDEMLCIIQSFLESSSLRDEQGLRNQARARQIAELVRPGRFARFLGEFAQLGSSSA